MSAVPGRAVGRARTLVGFAALGLFWGTWGASLPAIQRHADADDAFLGIALLCVGAGALASMRLAGAALDRVGNPGLPVTVLGFAFATVLPALATSPVALIVALLVVGATSGALDVAINAEATRYEAVARPVLNLAHAFFSAAVLVSALLTGALRTASDSIFLPFTLAAALLLAAALTIVRLPAAPHTSALARRQASRLWHVPRPLAILGLLGALAYFVENAWQSWSAVHLERTLAAGPAQAAVGPAVFAGAAVCGRLLGQALAARAEARLLLATGAVVAAVGSVVAATAPSVAVALAGIAVAGFGTSVCAPTVISLGGKIAALGERASAISIVTTLAYSGFLIGPALVGLTADVLSLRAALVGVAALALLLAALARVAPGREADARKL